MPLIITATDFSATGNNAVHYACSLALAGNSELIVIHTFMIPVMFSDIALPNNLVNDAHNDSEAQMNQLIATLIATYPGLAVTGKTEYGEVIDALDDYSTADKAPWLVVVGNNNTSDSSSFDSTLLETLKQSKFPVLAVPPSVSYQPVKRICFAFDNKYPGSDLALLQLRDMKQLLHAELHVLYAQPDVPNRDNIADIDEQTKTVLAPANPSYHFTYDTSIEKTIAAFIPEKEIDWLVLMPRKHSFFEGLFHKSHTKAMAHDTHIPILSLHENS